MSRKGKEKAFNSRKTFYRSYHCEVDDPPSGEFLNQYSHALRQTAAVPESGPGEQHANSLGFSQTLGTA